MNIIILGQQGSGKGTQAELLAGKYKLEHIDMGKTLRQMAKLDTPLAKEIYDIQNVTKTLVPSRILKEMLHLKLNSLDREQGLIFDGVPRTLDQARYFEEALREFGRKIDKIFFVNIPEAETIVRISKRFICDDCRENLTMDKEILTSADPCPKCGGKIMQRIDDTPGGIKKRLQVFAEETMPVINYFKEKGLVVEINGMQSVEKVFADIVSHIEKA